MVCARGLPCCIGSLPLGLTNATSTSSPRPAHQIADATPVLAPDEKGPAAVAKGETTVAKHTKVEAKAAAAIVAGKAQVPATAAAKPAAAAAKPAAAAAATPRTAREPKADDVLRVTEELVTKVSRQRVLEMCGAAALPVGRLLLGATPVLPALISVLVSFPPVCRSHCHPVHAFADRHQPNGRGGSSSGRP